MCYCYISYVQCMSIHYAYVFRHFFQVFLFTMHVSKSLCGWLVVLVGVERMVAVIKPHKVKLWYTKKNVSKNNIQLEVAKSH